MCGRLSWIEVKAFVITKSLGSSTYVCTEYYTPLYGVLCSYSGPEAEAGIDFFRNVTRKAQDRSPFRTNFYLLIRAG